MDAASTLNERRIFDRFSSRFPAKIKDSRSQYGEHIYLRDASAEGAKLTVTERMYLNDSVILEVRLPDKDHPMTIRGQVVWTKHVNPNIWDVGLRFHNVDLVHMSRLYEVVESS